MAKVEINWYSKISHLLTAMIELEWKQRPSTIKEWFIEGALGNKKLSISYNRRKGGTYITTFDLGNRIISFLGYPDIKVVHYQRPGLSDKQTYKYLENTIKKIYTEPVVNSLLTTVEIKEHGFVYWLDRIINRLFNSKLINENI